MIYRLCEVAVALFVSLATYHAILLRQLGGPVMMTPDAMLLGRTLMDYRVLLIVGFALPYLYMRATGKDYSTLLTVGCTLAWFTFLEDTLALDNVLFVPELITGKLTQFSRPVFLIALAYMTVDARRRKFLYV
ncbi:hypothetical protein N9V47_03970 [Luminiphilus sp.]|nr:hypothetical protein [Luminiphilus sp.]MDB2312794.1 hypothetical protein [Luminiphilus sp.]